MKYILIILAFVSLSSFQAKTEEQKIQHLIKYVAGLENTVFIRNGSEYTPAKAADHLKMKWEKAGSNIKTATDFINELASKSSMTGKYYTIKYKDGRVIKVQDLLVAELKKISKN